MSRLSRWTSALLAVCTLINLIPVPSFAQTEETVSEETVLSAADETTAYLDETVVTIVETTLTGETTQPTEAETTPTEETTQPTEEQTVPTEGEMQTIELDGDVNALAISDDFSASHFAAVLEDEGYTQESIREIISVSQNKVTLTIKKEQADVLALLSNVVQGPVPSGEEAPQVFDYSQWEISFPDITGTFNLPDNFKGLGDPDYPFAGTLIGQEFTFSTQNTLFKALDAGADLGKKSIRWTGTAGKAILTETLYVDNTAHPINMPLTSATAFSPYIGELVPKGSETELGEITLPTLNYAPGTSEGASETTYDGSAGLLCGSMADNTKLTAGTLTLPEIPVSITASGNAGTLVGSMGSNAQLTIAQNNLTISSTLTATDGDVGGLVGSMDQNAVLCVSGALTLTTTVTNSQNAGGLVGTMAAGAGITLGADMTVTNTLTAQKSAGGIAGEVTTETGPITAGEGKTITLTADGKITGGENAGGLYGSCTASGDIDPFAGVTITDETVTVGGNGSCGGLFGTLEFTGEGNKCELTDKTLYAKLCSATTSTRFGGIVGTLTGTRQNALVVSNSSEITDTTNPHITTNTKYNGSVLKPQYLGGIVAYQNATLDVQNVCVKLADASQTAAADENYYTGGLSAFVCNKMLLKGNNLRIVIDGYDSKDHNGGVAGYTGNGSIVYLENQLLLKDCPLQSVAGCGQIVARQDCSLIYGPSVTISRWGKSMEVDDIGNYGELYRVPDFLEVKLDYSTASKRTLTAQDGIYTLYDELDYACLALAWQSRGVFETVSGIGTTNWQTLQSCSINLGDNIVLTGMGIGGLSRDVYSEDDVFGGNFDGNNKTLTLDIGACNSIDNNATSGDGRIYFHNSTGLFAGLSSTATVKNLTLAGSIRLSNNRLPVNDTDQSTNMKTGALAGLLLCEGGGSNITKVSTTVNITANSNTVTPNAPFYIGGLFGLAYGNDATTLTLDGNLGASISHAITESDEVPIIGQCFHTGGAIGAVDAGCTKLKIKCDEAVISGKIERKGDTADNFYAGGLIGTIFPSEGSSRTIELKKLTVNDFTLSGSAEKRMGGVLGGIWADTDVTVSGLVVQNATLTASDKAKLGGLVYRASGKWEVSSADLGGLTITASSAEALGLMVCQGGPYKEPLKYNKDGSSSTTYQEIGGLYLVMTENWAWENNNGYNVPTSITFVGDVFDEFVAYTAYAHYTDGNKDTPPYSITSNGSGIISLKTANGIVNMTSGSCNTYENRTGVGTGKNLYSRYYYNLPEVKNACNTGDLNRIDTPQELLIWSVNRYAAGNLKADKREDFNITGVDTSDIGGSSDTSCADFNMSGFSYYPIRITDPSITVQYAHVKFYNHEIEEQVSNKKSTRGSAGDHTQHYTMHCGLFMDFAAENIKASAAHTMTVNGVTFAGTVGKVNGHSGALICGSVHGDNENSNIATCTVVLADSDNTTKAVTLNGISVDSTEDYRPVLIGHMDSYSGLKANYVTTNNTTQTQVAGSSLVGTVGSENAVGIAIAFAGTIKLPDTANAVFTKATLLHSLRYQSGSTATYRFNKDKDWQGNTHVQNITYGYEISESKEFPEDKGCYYDGFGEQYYISASGDFSKLNSFTGYLPYVAYSPAKGGADLDQGWHELEVNILASDLKEGCGTYGHPYHVNAKDLRYVAIYLSKPSEAPKNWKIMYPSQQQEYHTTVGGDIELTFDGTQWTGGGKTYLLEDIQKYLSQAYYVIDTDMTLRNFSGLGTANLPFTGVVTGEDINTEEGVRKPKVTLSGTTPAFINYSYGSVVRNLEIELAQNLSLLSSAPSLDGSNRKAEAAPGNFFGGVIGCVLGGDNIIDTVGVSTTIGFSLSFTGTNATFAHLVPIGGYVGVIAGGGVIFRGTCSGGISDDNTAESSTYLYRNPIVGRVLGGYAFYEGNAANAPDNTDKNYKINKISSGTHLSLSGDTLTIKDSEGLLILSAIVSSGAGSYGNSLAYKTDYGVARVAKYDKVGNGAATEPDDYALANNQTTPYLLSSKFLEGTASQICKDGPQTGITLKLDADIDMSGYGNGYRGLSARYASNAGFTAASTLSPYTVVMRLKSFDGNNKTVSGISMDVQEYDDDDFHAASMGGIFNIAWTNNGTGGSSNSSNASSKYDSVLAKNLTLKDCTVKLEYIGADGNPKPQAQYQYFTQKDGISTVAVGGFIGTVNDRNSTGMGSTASNYLFENIRVEATEGKHSTIYGPVSAGGIIGASGMGSNGYPAMLLTNGGEASSVKFGPSFLNCSYKNTDVTGYLAAGGMVGCAATGFNNLNSFGDTQAGTSGCYATCTITDPNLTFARSSTVTTKAAGGICGGVFGGIGMRGLINDQKVDSLTDLTITSEGKPILLMKFVDVDILADVAFSNYIYLGTGAANGVDKGATVAAAGCIARISNPNEARIYQVQMGSSDASDQQRCTIQVTRTGATTPKVTAQYASGLVAYGYTTRAMTISDCKVYGTDISAPTAGGLIAVAGFNTLKISNCTIEDCKINASTRAGGLAGYFLYSDCTANLLNILIKNTSVTKNNVVKEVNTNNVVEEVTTIGRLFGTMDKVVTLSAAGISVFNKDNTILLPEKDSASASSTPYTGYIAYADYLATQENTSGANAPYVTVNPSYSLPLDSTTKTLIGDAVKASDSYGSIGGQIWMENSNGAPATKENYASYPAAKGIAKPTISTFHKELGEGPDDLPVLVVKGGDSSAITNYLDIITNGGYTLASNETVDKVSFTTTVYYWDDVNQRFDTKTTDSTHDGPEAVTIVNNRPVVSGTSYDNSRHRFTLVEAAFETDLGNYTVSIPVVVLRKLEYVYMTTFSYGTEFHEETYQDIRTHLLESTGVPFSAYLTFQYNQAYNASADTKLEYAEYDWKSYIEGGGNLVGMDKTLNFSVKLPKDTQLTLVDCQHGNQAYYYTVAESGEQEIRFSSFLNDSTAFPFSMADLLGVTRSEKTAATGAFTKLDNRVGATLLVNGEYFRPANETDAAGNRYDLIFPEDLSSAVPEENYYLVITVPKQFKNGQPNPEFSLNGHLEVRDTYLIPTNPTPVHRYGGHSESTHESDETTYQISSGYQQSPEAITPYTAPVDLNDVNNAMHIELKDTITFSNRQAYSTTDLLFLKFTASLKKIGEDEAGKQTEADSGFPAGTSGTVKFYIQDSAGNYFVPNGRGWDKQSTEPDGTTSGYPTYYWVSDGGNLSLPLSADGKTPIDLSVVRNMIKDNQSEGTSEIIVTAKMENVVVPPGGDDDPIPSSEDGIDTWAQIHYLAQLSTQARSLNYSTVRAVADDETHYYRKAVNKVILSMDAAKIRQLGVNPLAPVDEDLVNGRSRINLNAALDMTGLKDREALLQKTDHIVFTLSLERRNDGVSGSNPTYETVENGGDFISFLWPDGSNGWSFTISKENGQFNQEFNADLYLFPLTAYVAMNQKQYANYQIKMDVKFKDANRNDTLNPNESIDISDAYVVYTYACINPTFYEFKNAN